MTAYSAAIKGIRHKRKKLKSTSAIERCLADATHRSFEVQTGHIHLIEEDMDNIAQSGGQPSSDEELKSKNEEPCAREITKPPKIGEEDVNGAVITNIYATTRQFVVYEANEQVRYLLPKAFEVAKGLRLKIAELGGLRASIEDLRCDPTVSANERMRAARETAWALALAFENEKAAAAGEPKDILTRVDGRLRSLVKSHYRKKYCIANLAAFVAIEVALVILAVAGSFIYDTENVLHRYAIYGCFGGLGAFLSVITGIRSIEIDINLSRWEHVFAGATRILIGVMGAIVIGLALDSRLIDPTFGHTPPADANTPAGTLESRFALKLILAFVAGFSESLVPNLLRRGERTIIGSDKADATNAPIVKEMKPS